MLGTVELLFRSIEERWRPDDVAKLLVDQPPSRVAWMESELQLLRKAARRSWRDSRYWEQYGAKGFAKHQVALRALSHPVFARLSKAGTQAEQVEAAVARLRAHLKVSADRGSSFRWDRATGKARKKLKLGLSRRQYNKRFRMLRALLKKGERIAERGPLARFLQVAKSGLAATIDREQLGQHPAAVAFVAYYVARKQRQSTFTNQAQSRAWDEVCEVLFARLRRARSRLPWEQIARAVPTPEVLRQCTLRVRLRFLAEIYQELLDAAKILDRLWTSLGADQVRMVVQRGMNSSDWNAAAGAWNELRKAWLGALAATGRLADLERFCPGKAMRLMAADVVRWHEASGGEVDPNTVVFSRLPLPWKVVLGKARCTASAVREACEGVLPRKRRVYLDDPELDAEAERAVAAVFNPEKTGWLEPLPKGVAEETRPTPALVHGVVVENPALADVLRRAGWFEGKSRIGRPVPGVRVVRDPHGAAVGVTKATVSKSRA